MKYFRTGCIAICMILFAKGDEEKTIEQWAMELGSEDPAIREKAERESVIPDAILEQLAKHPDPWTAARAKRLLMGKSGIDARIPMRLQQAVLNFDSIEATRRAELLEELSKPGPGRLNALTFLYNRLTAEKTFPESESSMWQQRIRSSIFNNPEDAGNLKPESLSPATRAFLLPCFPDRLPKEQAERYRNWRKLDLSIRNYLTTRTISLEIDCLKENANTKDLLEYIPRIIDPSARQRAVSQASEIIYQDKAFQADELGESAAIGYLLALLNRGDLQKAMPWYEKHIKTHPGISATLPAELLPLEVNRLLKAGEISKAIEQALRPVPQSDRQTRIDSSTISEISKALGTKPESMPQGLPAMDSRSLAGMSQLLMAWFPMYRPGSGYPDIDAKVECFDRWAKSDEWLEAARCHGPRPLYHLVMLRRGKIAEILLAHEFDGESEALGSLGSLLLMRPELGKQIPYRQCSQATLRHVLDGGFQGLNADAPLPGPLLDLAGEWNVFYPNLLAPKSFANQPLYQAAIAWRKGELEAASAALLGCTKPISNDPAKNDIQEVRPRPNPLAATAIILLANLLTENSNADMNLLLPKDQVSRETLQLMLNSLVRADYRTPGQVRAAMAISAMLQDRFDLKELKPLFSSHEALSFALDAWMMSDEKLAGDFLLHAYLTGSDPKGNYDSILAPALMLLKRADDALAALDSAKTSLSPSIIQSKRARMLRELGRTKEAMDLLSTEHHPELRLRLEIETGKWDTTFRSVLDMEKNAKMREAMNACIAIFSGNSELMSRHTVGKHPVVNLLKGNGIREDDIAEMARDAELLARLEARLTAALASGDPILSIDMSAYFQHLDLLPNKQRAALLAAELAKRDYCVFSQPSSNEKLTGHKLLAAETLLLLGRGELAFGAVRPLMEASVEPHEFKGVDSGVVSGGQIQIVAAGYRQATRVAHFEWPQETAAKRMDKLAAILEHKDPLTRARGMIELISKHEAKLEKPDLLQALHLPFLDLTHSGEVPEALKETARALLANRQPNQQEKRWLESQWGRVSWNDETRHRPFKGKPTTKVTLMPKPGSMSNPKQSDFVILDGLSSATELHKKGKIDDARVLLRDLTIRVLLDYKMARQKAEWNYERQSPAGSSSSGFGTNGFLSVLCYFDMLEIPYDLVADLIDACANSWTNYSDDKRLYHAAHVMEKAGNHAAALAYYQRFLIATVPAFGSEDVGLSGRKEIAEMQRVRGMLAAGNGDSAIAVDAVQQLVQISPYQPEGAKDIAALLKKNGNAEALKSARAAIDGFWRIRLLEIPDSETYRYWKNEWELLFP